MQANQIGPEGKHSNRQTQCYGEEQSQTTFSPIRFVISISARPTALACRMIVQQITVSATAIDID
jgi:hypothetical protein